MEQKKIPFLIGIPFTVVGLLATFFKDIIDLFKPRDKTNVTVEKALIEKAERLEKIVEEYENKLKEIIARDDQPAWERDWQVLYEKDDVPGAIKSIERSLKEEAAQKHIRIAQLYVIKYQFAKAEKQYKKAATIFPSYDTNFAIAQFYSNLNKFHEAISYFQKCLNFEITLQDRAGVLNDMGSMQRNNNAYREAEASYQEALETFMELAAQNPDTYLPFVAGTLNCLGNLYANDNEFLQAEASFQKALTIQREFVAKNPDAYLPNVAITLNNLGGLHWKKNDYPKAEIAVQEALNIRRELAAQNPDTYLTDVASTLNNLGVLYRNKKEYSQAEASFQEALTIRKKLAVKNPDAYLPNVAMTLNNLGILYMNNNECSQAEALYQEALTIRKRLAVKNPDAYLPNVAETLTNLSIIYLDDLPNKKLSLQYANETIEVVGKCNNTPYIQRQLYKAQKIIEYWEKKSQYNVIVC